MPPARKPPTNKGTARRQKFEDKRKKKLAHQEATIKKLISENIYLKSRLAGYEPGNVIPQQDREPSLPGSGNSSACVSPQHHPSHQECTLQSEKAKVIAKHQSEIATLEKQIIEKDLKQAAVKLECHKQTQAIADVVHRFAPFLTPCGPVSGTCPQNVARTPPLQSLQSVPLHQQRPVHPEFNNSAGVNCISTAGCPNDQRQVIPTQPQFFHQQQHGDTVDHVVLRQNCGPALPGSGFSSSIVSPEKLPIPFGQSKMPLAQFVSNDRPPPNPDGTFGDGIHNQVYCNDSSINYVYGHDQFIPNDSSWEHPKLQSDTFSYSHAPLLGQFPLVNTQRYPDSGVNSCTVPICSTTNNPPPFTPNCYLNGYHIPGPDSLLAQNSPIHPYSEHLLM